MNRFLHLFVAFSFACVLTNAAQAEISPLTFHDFEDGTVMDWTRGNMPVPTNPTNVADGGPNGVGDNYLQITASGIPDVPGGRLVVTNSEQFGQDWTGNYLAAGITDISIDVINLNATVDLNMRLGFSNDQGAQTGFITPHVLLPAGSGWTTLTFSILEGEIFNDTGLVYSDVFQDIESIRVYDNSLPGNYTGFIHGQPVAFGLDNVRALTAIPEPSALAFLSACFGASFLRRRRR